MYTACPWITSPAGAVAKYCDEYVCLCLSVCPSDCLSARISPEPHARFLPNFLCMLPISVVRSSSGMFTIGCIAYRREWVFFPIENALSAGKGGWECTARVKYAIYDCLVKKFFFNLVVIDYREYVLKRTSFLDLGLHPVHVKVLFEFNKTLNVAVLHITIRTDIR